jgi:hypothetical protein
MVLVAKHDGSPRRTVDFQELNKHSVRQTHPTTAPYLQAASVPKDKKKSVLDVWHSYHSVPIAREDVDTDTQHSSLPGADIGISPLLKVSLRRGMVLLTDTTS